MRVFELTKSRYPNWWYLIRLSYFFKDRDYKVRDMCTAVRRGIIGFTYACMLPWIVSFLFMVYLEPMFWLIHGFVGPGFFGLTFFLMVFWWTGIIVFACLFSAFYIWDEDYGNLGGRITNIIKSDKFDFLRRSTTKQPSAFAAWYDGIKDKYCPTVRLVDY